jgi:uncharacterized protein
MATNMLGELTHNQIDQILQQEVIGRLGCYANQKIYVVPITYVFDGKCIYAHSREGLKVEMMRKNPLVCFEVDAMENMSNWRSAIVWGTYEELTTLEGVQAGMKLLTDRFLPMMVSDTLRPWHGHPPEAVEKGTQAVVFRIHVNEKTGRFEKTDFNTPLP